MARKKKKKQSKGMNYLLALVALACIAYQPIQQALNNLPQHHTATEVSAERVENKAYEEYKRKQESKEYKNNRENKESRENKGYKNNRENKESRENKGYKPGTESKEGLEIPAKLTDRSELILKRKGYTTSYNKELKIPNWVAWELTPEKLVERESRTDKFLPDPDLPESQAVTTDDYKGAGLDRGHMCPAGDNRWHWRAMQESFYMTNICPQNHNLNRGDWKELEEACRRWAQAEGRIYIVCGPILYNQRHRTIGRQHKVTVPEAFFKVILCTDSRPPKAIGFIYKNASGNHPLDNYVNTVDEVERITGIDFFPTLPDEVEKKVEAKYDLDLWK